MRTTLATILLFAIRAAFATDTLALQCEGDSYYYTDGKWQLANGRFVIAIGRNGTVASTEFASPAGHWKAEGNVTKKKFSFSRPIADAIGNDEFVREGVQIDRYSGEILAVLWRPDGTGQVWFTGSCARVQRQF